MQLSTCICAMAATFTALTSAVAIPSTLHASHSLDQPEATSPHSQIMGSLSSLLGYQLAGTAVNEKELTTLCNTVTNMGGSNWVDLGLVPANVRAPLCNAAHTDPNATYAITNSIMAHSAIFATQVVHSFNSTARLSNVCDDLQLDLIDYFPMNGGWVKDVVCKRAGTERGPQPESTPPPSNPDAVKAARNTASMLYAILLAAGATTGSELSRYCAHAPKYAKELNAEHINGTLVESTLCSITDPISAPVAQEMLQAWMTRWYITVLENVSNVSNWKGWLCDNLDVNRMNAVGLNGVGVQQQVCGDSVGAA